MDNSTIIAIATPPGPGGIGIIKISGPNAIPVVTSLFRQGSIQANQNVAEASPVVLRSWRLYYGYIFDPETGRIFDEVLLSVMRAPHSYTREDVVEIQAHSGPYVLHSILKLLLKRDIRLAEPGEFTRRAFVNGRIDLTQAEAVIDIINAQSEAAIDMAVAQISGGLKAAMDELKGAISSILAQIDAAIDFPEATEDEIDTDAMATQLSASVLAPLTNLIDQHNAENFLREGLRVVIVGGPNVGKSSLMNRLLQKDRVIVSDQPGTTRDFVEASFVERGLPIVLTDTAGFRTDAGPVERLGIEQARRYIDTADILLCVIDAGKSLRKDDLSLFEELSKKRRILVVNKSDLPDEGKRFSLPEQWLSLPVVRTSALLNEGIDDLKQTIFDEVTHISTSDVDRIVPNLRHKQSLERCRTSISSAIDCLFHSSFELAAIDLRDAIDAICEITGKIVRPDILDIIFSRYCIGK